MKIKNISIYSGILLFGAVILTGCSDEETYDFDGTNDNLIYVDQSKSNITECTIYKTPIGDFGLVSAEIPGKLQYAIDDSLNLTAAANMELVEAFNEQQGTNYSPLPTEAIAGLEVTPAGISAGSTAPSSNVVVTLPSDYTTVLTDTGYVVPLTISGQKLGNSESERPLASSQTMANSYLVIHVTSDNFASFSGSETTTCTVVSTPVGVFGGETSLSVALKAASNTTLEATAVVNNSLVSQYNSDNGTNYETLPSDIQLTITPATIAEGESSGTIKVAVPKDKASELAGHEYLVPVQLQYGANGKSQTEESQVKYIVISVKSSMINDDATEIVGSIIALNTMTCLEADNLDPDAFSTFANNGSYGRWSFLSSTRTDASFTLDFGSEKNITGFYLNCYVLKDAEFLVSTDQTTWTSIGSTSGHNYVYKYDRTTWTTYYEYVLYGSVPARYIKVKFSLDSSNRYWSYYRYFNRLYIYAE